MPRRKKYTISAKQLSIYYKIVAELSANPDLSDYDMETIELTILKRIDPYVKDINKVIRHFQLYLAANKKFLETINEEQLITRTKLAKMLGISRPTLNNWIKKEFITPVRSKYLSNTETFHTDTVLEQLQKLKWKFPQKNGTFFIQLYTAPILSCFVRKLS